MTEQPTIKTTYDDADLRDIPDVIQFSDEQRKYVIDLLSAAQRVIEGTSSLESEEKNIFGKGQFYWPKDPTKPIKAMKYYTHNNFRMRGITLQFDRKNERSEWEKARLTVLPRNFPYGVYAMGLPQSVFNDFRLERKARESRPEESVTMPIVFYFTHRIIRNLTLKVEARSDVTSIDSPYPGSFHVIEITRTAAP